MMNLLLIVLPLSFVVLAVCQNVRTARATEGDAWRRQFGIRSVFFAVTLVAAYCGIVRLPLHDMVKSLATWMLSIVAFGWLLRNQKPFGLSPEGHQIFAKRIRPTPPSSPVD